MNVVGRAFSEKLEYNKRLYDSVTGLSFRTTTLNSDGIGTHGGDAGYIMQTVSERLDHFILEYLRVNETACE